MLILTQFEGIVIKFLFKNNVAQQDNGRRFHI